MESKNIITEAIREIIDTRGISSLEDYAVFCAMLDDMAPLAIVESFLYNLNQGVDQRKYLK